MLPDLLNPDFPKIRRFEIASKLKLLEETTKSRINQNFSKSPS